MMFVFMFMRYVITNEIDDRARSNQGFVIGYSVVAHISTI